MTYSLCYLKKKEKKYKDDPEYIKMQKLCKSMLDDVVEPDTLASCSNCGTKNILSNNNNKKKE